MKNLKNHFKKHLVIVSIIALAIYISCNKATTKTFTPKPIVNKCLNTVCDNGGQCDTSNGSCICPKGYEGPYCDGVSRNKFLGNWYVFEKGSMSGPAQYPISIAAGTNITDIVIRNFYNYFITPIKGYVNGDTLYIPNQQYEGKKVLGMGYVYSNNSYGQYGSISMSYEIIDSATGSINDFGYNHTDSSAPSAWNK